MDLSPPQKHALKALHEWNTLGLNDLWERTHDGRRWPDKSRDPHQRGVLEAARRNTLRSLMRIKLVTIAGTGRMVLTDAGRAALETS